MSREDCSEVLQQGKDPALNEYYVGRWEFIAQEQSRGQSMKCY